MYSSLHTRSNAHVDPVPSWTRNGQRKIGRSRGVVSDAQSVGIPVAVDGEVPRELARGALNAAGFAGKVGQTLIVPRGDGPTLVAFGIGERAQVDAATLRDAAAAFARAAQQHEHIATSLPEGAGVPPAAAAQALVEGFVLGRYRYRPLKRAGEEHELLELDVVSEGATGFGTRLLIDFLAHFAPPRQASASAE